jgi:hypothetical protein
LKQEPTFSWQMFAGHFPFLGETNNRERFPIALIARKRPLAPMNPSRLKTRGFNDDMWHLMEACWDEAAINRPSVAQVIESLRQLPACAVDNRPHDFNIAPTSQMWYNQEQHPFSALAPGPGDSEMLKALKRMPIEYTTHSGIAMNPPVQTMSDYSNIPFFGSTTDYHMSLSSRPSETARFVETGVSHMSCSLTSY